MTNDQGAAPPDPHTPSPPARAHGFRTQAGVAVFWCALVLLAANGVLSPWSRDRPIPLPEAVSTWTSVFVSVALQSLPFLALGVTLSAVVTARLPVERLLRNLPGGAATAVPAAGAAGILLPGCECASVPVAAGLIRRGVPEAAALTFLLAAPAVNPVVLVSTAVAFTGFPEMVWARFAASLLASITVGWLWAWTRGGLPPAVTALAQRHHEHGDEGILATMRHDVVHAGGFVVLGAMFAATVHTALPPAWLDSAASRFWISVVALGLAAVLIAVCSEADAFVAASFVQFPATAKLAFMVVGPMVDVKLISLQAGTFGRAFALRFAPLCFAVGISSSLLVGGWLL